MKCEFVHECNLFSRTSATCNNGGGDYCGRWRELKEQKELNTQINVEMLYQQTGRMR
ncbi:MAG: hypothetical protein ABSA75_13415 [Candidatus Bathyarchaeia archaeon]|jgi:hypothetical protein